ncbi:MAG: hypothetical protein S4CHLAM37_04250 [Chlamydiia bacterium]|nr:hypothetical protein [Chlamydiia bacterium]
MKEKFENAESGSYIVTEFQNVLSLLRIHSLEEDKLYIEEINAPASSPLIKKKKWEEWIQNKAPGASSWLLYEIDLKKGTITDCYSFDQKTHINLENQQSFLATLMFLRLEPITGSDRKKIGPKPEDEASDQRKVWNPPKVVSGKKVKGTNFLAMRTKWPKDGSELSQRTIDLYFDEKETSFPFPYWIEVGDTHNVFKLRVTDSGNCKNSPLKRMPKKLIEVDSISLDKKKGLNIVLKHANAYKEFQILATASSGHTFATILLPHKIETEGSEFKIHVPTDVLEQHLETNTAYTFVILPVDEPRLAAEPRQSFVWR